MTKPHLTQSEMMEQGKIMFERYGCLTGKVYADNALEFGKNVLCKVNTMKSHGDSHYVGGFLVMKHDDGKGTELYEVRDGDTFRATDPVEVTEAELEGLHSLIVEEFQQAYGRISEKSYLFKFEDGEGKKLEQVLPYINASRLNNYPVHFYYAPTSACFRLVEILPENVVIERNEDGETKVKSFKYRENQLTIEGNPFSSSNRNLRLIRFKSQELKDSATDGVQFGTDMLYLLSRWHYQQILELIMD